MSLYYAKAADLLRSARNQGDGKPIDNNTRLFWRDDEAIALRLHNTDILTFYPNGDVRFNSGGWKTVTTKSRLNEYGPARIWSDRGEWVINDKPFLDGCVLKADGTMKGVGDGKTLQQQRDLRKAATKFAADYVKHLAEGKMNAPSSGDCWFCCLHDVKTGKPFGDHQADHIKAHIRECYYVPSLIWNAMDALGASDYYKQWVNARQHNNAEKMYGDDFMPERLRKFVRRYVLRELGMSY